MSEIFTKIGGYIASGDPLVYADSASMTGDGTVASPFGVNKMDMFVQAPLFTGTSGEGDNTSAYIGFSGDSFIKLLSVSQEHTANNSNFTITADVPTGYNFLAWLNVTTNGFSQAFYPLSPGNSATVWWRGGAESPATAGCSVNANYLVIKQPEA